MKFMKVETGYIRADRIEFLTVVGEMITNADGDTATEKYSVSAILTENEIVVSPYFDIEGEAETCLNLLVKQVERLCEANS